MLEVATIFDNENMTENFVEINLATVVADLIETLETFNKTKVVKLSKNNGSTKIRHK